MGSWPWQIRHACGLLSAGVAVLPKFLPPRPRHLLVRPRLHALLDAVEPARGLWLAEPAGAGKSTLAAS